VAKEGRSTACEEGKKEEVWQMWRKQSQGQKVFFCEAVGRQVEAEKRLAQGGGKGNPEGSVGRKM